MIQSSNSSLLTFLNTGLCSFRIQIELGTRMIKINDFHFVLFLYDLNKISLMLSVSMAMLANAELSIQ